MAGKIIADTLETGAGADISTSYVVNGSAKAWCTFQGTGTASIKDSLNASSITDVGTGQYTITLTNSLNNTNYNVQISTHGTGSYSDWVAAHWYDTNYKSASSYRIEAADESDNFFDIQEGSGLLHGDLA
tara:strand:+ start:14 stop:403 length:390 start_codon:yes stop_codon:yes gene_type:complete